MDEKNGDINYEITTEYNGFGPCRYLFASGESVRLSATLHGTKIYLQPSESNGFILGLEYDISEQEDLLNLDASHDLLYGTNVKECINRLRDKRNYISYEALLEYVNIDNINVRFQPNFKKDFTKYETEIKNAEKIYFNEWDYIDRNDFSSYRCIYIMLNYKKIMDELEEIDKFCYDNKITQHCEC